VDTADAPAVARHLSAAIRLLDLFRLNSAATQDKSLRLLLRRLVRIRSHLEKLATECKTEK
jgi:hypothetical protein